MLKLHIFWWTKQKGNGIIFDTTRHEGEELLPNNIGL